MRFGRLQSLLRHRAPGLVLLGGGEKRPPIFDGFLELPVLFLGDGDENARLEQRSVAGQRLLEDLARVLGDEAVIGEHKRLALAREKLGRRTEQLDRARVGLGRVAVAARAKINRRDRLPALSLVGMRAQARFDPCDQRIDVLLVRRIVETRGERLVGKAGRAVGEIEAERKQREHDAHNQDRRPVAAATPLGATGLARVLVGCKEAARDFDARGFGFALANYAPRAIARDLAELIAIDRGVERLGRAGLGSRRDQRTQQDEENDRRERGEHEPKDHRATCLC
jgi:hypothetical protein